MHADFDSLPDKPCDVCMTDARAIADTPIGPTVYCRHHAALAILDKRFGRWVCYAPVRIEEAADIVAFAIADREASTN